MSRSLIFSAQLGGGWARGSTTVSPWTTMMRSPAMVSAYAGPTIRRVARRTAVRMVRAGSIDPPALVRSEATRTSPSAAASAIEVAKADPVEKMESEGLQADAVRAADADL